MKLFLACIISFFILCMVPVVTLAGDQQTITVEGSSTILPIIKAAAKLFHGMTSIGIKVKGGGSRQGVSSVMYGRATIGMVSRALTPSEAKKLQAYLIGYDGIAVILNFANPLNQISKRDIINIYSGVTTNWKDVGGKDMEITAIAKKTGRSTEALFNRFFSMKKAHPSIQTVGSNTEVIILVASNPAAIGYVSIGTAERARELGLRLKLLPLDGVKASLENIANKKYPFRRPLNLVTLNNQGIEVRRFIDFMLKSQGQELVRENHFLVLDKVQEQE